MNLSLLNDLKKHAQRKCLSELEVAVKTHLMGLLRQLATFGCAPLRCAHPIQLRSGKAKAQKKCSSELEVAVKTQWMELLRQFATVGCAPLRCAHPIQLRFEKAKAPTKCV